MRLSLRLACRACSVFVTIKLDGGQLQLGYAFQMRNSIIHRGSWPIFFIFTLLSQFNVDIVSLTDFSARWPQMRTRHPIIGNAPIWIQVL